MTANVYATRRDVYRYGLPRGTLSMKGRELESVSASSDLLELNEHGFDDGDQVLVRAAEGGTLATPLVQGTPYYVIRVTDATFKLAATEGGDPIDLTVDGASMIVASPLPFDDVLEEMSRVVDGIIPHVVPLTAPYPITVVAATAKLAAQELQRLAGITSASTKDMIADLKERLTLWAKGVPIRDAKVTTGSSNLAIATSAGNSPGRPWKDTL